MNFLEGWRKAKNFSQRSKRQLTETMERSPRCLLSVHFVVKWFEDTDTLITLRTL